MSGYALLYAAITSANAIVFASTGKPMALGFMVFFGLVCLMAIADVLR